LYSAILFLFFFLSLIQENRKVKVTVEKTFRGRKYPKLVEIESVSYKTDYRLLSKVDESLYCKIAAESVDKILAPTIELPPLLRAFIEKETNQKNPTTKVIIQQSRDNVYRLAKDDEKPNSFLEMGVGKPISMRFYEGIDLTAK
jgi:small subunit ribosomal protein S34